MSSVIGSVLDFGLGFFLCFHKLILYEIYLNSSVLLRVVNCFLGCISISSGWFLCHLDSVGEATTNVLDFPSALVLLRSICDCLVGTKSKDLN